MKRFNFKLEPVLTIRRDKEEQIRILFVQAEQKMLDAVQEREELENHRQGIIYKLENFKTKPYGIDDLIIYQAYLETVEHRIVGHDLRIKELGDEMEKIRQQLLGAARDKKMIEKIKEKEKIRHSFLSLKNEIEFLDEVGVIRCARTKISEAG